MSNSNSNNSRDILFNSIWKAVNDLSRGVIDVWDFKDYILGFMFYRYLSNYICNYINVTEQRNDPNFSYEKNVKDHDINDDIKQKIVKSIGFFIYPSELFSSVYEKYKDDYDNLNEDLATIFNNIENRTKGTDSESNFKELFQIIDLNSDKLGNNPLERNKLLIKIINEINNWNLDNPQNHKIDVFGDAYEYLISMCSSNAGKTGGEFYTPQQVSKLLAHLCLDNFNGKPKNAYDPACGSSSLLLQVGKIFKKQYNDSSIELDGQERNLTTYRLSRMNMFLHGINYSNFDIQQDDTLLNPKHLNNKYDIIVSNPPYSIHWDTDNKPTLINDERYSGPGVLAPKTKADFAFILHVLYQLSPTGIAAIICFPGIFYRSGAEQKIRKYLVDGNYVQALISLPNNLFFGTSIDTVVLVLKKNKTNNDVLFINASDFYNKVTNKNDLSDEHIQKILDIYAQHIDGEYSKVVNNEIIKDNNYDLSVNKYITKIVKKEEIDIKQLNEEIKNISERNQQLRFDIESLIKEIEND